MKKILYIVLDGLGDLPNQELNGKTPLEDASTPNLDGLTVQGSCGLMYPVKEGIAPESDVAVISLLGYDAEKYYTGRGPLECFAEGLKIEDGDLAYRVNFATLADESPAGEGTASPWGRRIVDRRVGRNLSTQEASALSKEINSSVKLKGASFEFKNTVGHRGVLVIRSRSSRLSSQVTNTDPAYAKEGVFGVAKKDFENVLLKCAPSPGYEGDPQTQQTASLTNDFIQQSWQVLEASAVNKKRRAEGKVAGNVILTRDAGDRLPKFPKIEELLGVKFGCFVEMPVEKGIALLTGMEVVKLPSATGRPELDYPERAKIALAHMNTYDGLYIHLKGPDEPAHDGLPLKKKESIEAIDRFFFGLLVSEVKPEQTLIAVTADHSTPCSLKAHSDDPVPLLIAGGNVQQDATSRFSERLCEGGSLGVIEGHNLMPLLIDLANK